MTETATAAPLCQPMLCYSQARSSPRPLQPTLTPSTTLVPHRNAIRIVEAQGTDGQQQILCGIPGTAGCWTLSTTAAVIASATQ